MKGEGSAPGAAAEVEVEADLKVLALPVRTAVHSVCPHACVKLCSRSVWYEFHQDITNERRDGIRHRVVVTTQIPAAGAVLEVARVAAILLVSRVLLSSFIFQG